jgi:C-terminal processing protease CtpA/Prc
MKIFLVFFILIFILSSCSSDKGKIGIVLTKVDDTIVILKVIKGTPAYRAGLRRDDNIIRIDGESAKDISLEDAISKITGPKGTRVTLSIRNRNHLTPKDCIVTRYPDNIATKIEFSPIFVWFKSMPSWAAVMIILLFLILLKDTK